MTTTNDTVRELTNSAEKRADGMLMQSITDRKLAREALQRGDWTEHYRRLNLAHARIVTAIATMENVARVRGVGLAMADWRDAARGIRATMDSCKLGASAAQ